VRLACLGIILLLGALLFQAASDAQTPPGSMGMPMVAPLFLENPQLSSMLTLVNSATISESADVVLLDPEGHQIVKRTITLGPHSQAEVAVRELLEAADSTVTMGSIEVNASDENMAIAAQLSISGQSPARALHFEEELVMPMAQKSKVTRAAVVSIAGSPVIALRSLSNITQRITVECLEHTGLIKSMVNVPPGALVLWRACVNDGAIAEPFINVFDGDESKARRSIGLSVATNGAPGGVTVYGVGLRADDTRGSAYAPINFVDPAQTRSSSTVFTGVPVGPTDSMVGASFQPELAVTNFGKAPADTTIHYSFTGLVQVQTDLVAHVVVPALSTRTVALPDLEADPGMQNSFVIDSSARPGELYASMRSVSDATSWVSDVLGMDAKQSHNGGLHPWNIADGTSSTLLLFNHTRTAQAFHVFIAQETTVWQKNYTLGALETRAISLNSLVATGQKDDLGQVLAPYPQRGQLGWFTESHEKGTGRLLEGRLIGRLARGFNCGMCTVLCGASTSPSTLTLLSTQTGTATETAQWCTSNLTCPGQCTGTPTTHTAIDQCSWAITNNAIASIQGSTTGATVTIGGLAPGLTAAQVRVSTATCLFIPQTQVKVQQPGQLYVLSDSYKILNGCPNTKYRVIAYQIQTAGGAQGIDITLDTQTKETFSSVGTNTCNTGVKTSGSCSTDTGGQIHDEFSVNCNTVGGSCGFTNTNQQWRWCPSNGSTSQVIATIGDLVVHNDGISVGGSYLVYPKGTIFGPSGKI
jgi:hypothetical protein